MSANSLTVIVGVLGIAVSAVLSYVFFWLGGRKSSAQNSELRSLISILVERRIADQSRPSLDHAQSETTDQSHQLVVSRGSSDALLSDVALEELLRASLAALVDERGEVQMTRLLREVSAAVGSHHISDALNLLRRLRDQAVVSWEGSDDDLTKVSTVHVMLVERPINEEALQKTKSA